MRAGPKIEIVARGTVPGMAPAAFLRRYWQKHPLLIRGALAHVRAPVAKQDLFALAADPDALARLVQLRGRRCTVRNGPIRADAYARLPERDWTMLVQDCDKWFAAAEDLLRHFAFIPRWRVDDVMVSYAVDGGSVGAHVDQYDVFLVQAQGRRRWSISTDPAAPKDFRPNQPLKLLRRFEPTHEWVLEPGDVLYLPPGVPHHGVAVGECLTCSVGMRAPSATELLMAFAGTRDDDETRRYVDPDLRPARDPGELDAAVGLRARRLLERLLLDEGPERGDWLGRFLTRYRSNHVAQRAKRAITASGLRLRIARGARLELSPWARALYQRTGRDTTLFVAGDAYPCSLSLARRLTGREPVGAAAGRSLGRRDWATLSALCNDGHAGIGRD